MNKNRILENWRLFISEETKDTYGSEIVDRNKRSRKKGMRELGLTEEEEGLNSKIRITLKDEGGAAGMGALSKGADATEADVKDAIKDMGDVGLHNDGDYILDDGDEIDVVDEGKLDIEQIIREEIIAFLEKKSKGKTKPGLWANIKAKKDRMKAGSGEKKAKRGDDDYPETLDIEEAIDEEYLTELENDPSETITCTDFLQRENLDEKKTAAWQRKAGKNKEGGLNAKGRKSYEKANPGSDLKAPVSAKQAKKSKGGKSAKRRKSFCARMCGMKKKNTGAKGKRDPDSRINKSLRKWDCNC
jgi:hypothetical protein